MNLQKYIDTTYGPQHYYTIQPAFEGTADSIVNLYIRNISSAINHLVHIQELLSCDSVNQLSIRRLLDAPNQLELQQCITTLQNNYIGILDKIKADWGTITNFELATEIERNAWFERHIY